MTETPTAVALVFRRVTHHRSGFVHLAQDYGQGSTLTACNSYCENLAPAPAIGGQDCPACISSLNAIPVTHVVTILP